MTRYVAIARRQTKAWAVDDYLWQDRPTLVVYESDPNPIDIGLVTAEGVPLFRVQERGPLGFLRTEND